MQVRLLFSLCILLTVAAREESSAQAGPTDSFADGVSSALFANADTVDLARAKLAVDKLIDPSIDVAANLKEVDHLADEARKLAGPSAKSAQKLAAVRKVIYEPGPWNGNRPFSYDMTDPAGTKLVNKLLPTYLRTRKGNCISMPILFVILADRLGLNATLSTAPRHVFVKYTDEAGKVWNIETTSGATPARDEYVREKMGPFTDEAIANGVYMKTLSRKEALAVIGSVLLQHLAEQNRRAEMIGVAEVLLRAYPNDAPTMVVEGSAYGRLLEGEFISKFPTPADILMILRPRYNFLAAQNDLAFAKAESLGWRETDGGLAN